MPQQPAAATDGLNPPRQTGRRKRHLFQIAAVLAAFSALAFGGNHFWSFLESYECTEDARIDANTTPIYASINGTITGLYVQPYQRVRAGQLVVRLDPSECEIAVELAKAQLSQAEADVDLSRQQYSLVRTKIDEAQARDLEARQNQQRYLRLLQMGVVSKLEYEQHGANVGVLGADVKADQAEAALASRDIAFRQAQVNVAKAALNQAILNLGYTRILAPADGFIGSSTGELGQRVEAGESLMVMSRADDFWVVANFKGRQLARIHREQAVTIHVPLIGRDFRGHIESMLGMTGSNLLSTKKSGHSYLSDAQGLPVPIAFDSGQDLSGLHPGMWVEPTVWLKAKPW